MLTRLTFLDNVMAIFFGLLIIYTGTKLVRKSLAGIMDEADMEIIRSIVTHLNEHRKLIWIDVHNLRIIQYGNKLHVDCHVTLPWYLTLEQAHQEIEEIALIINEKHSTQVEFFIHQDPCIPSSCKICSVENCPVRTEPLVKTTDWSVENLIVNKKHGL